MKKYRLPSLCIFTVWFIMACSACAETQKSQQSLEELQKPSKPAVMFPDLKIGEIWIEQNGTRVAGNLYKGEQYKFICTFSNIGFNSARASKAAYYIDEKLAYSQQIGKLPVGYSTSISWSYTPDKQAIGTHAVECVVDYEGLVLEGDKQNNRLAMQFNVIMPLDRPVCKGDRECSTGNCVDGVCCESKCEGNCRYCAFPGQEGKCLAVPDGQDPKRACQISQGGHPDCGGACYSGQCTFPDVGTPCGICAVCNGTGRCILTPPDDSRCGVIDCDGLNSQCRIYHDLRSNRCAALGMCKEPNDWDSCTDYADLPCTHH